MHKMSGSVTMQLVFEDDRATRAILHGLHTPSIKPEKGEAVYKIIILHNLDV